MKRYSPPWPRKYVMHVKINKFCHYLKCLTFLFHICFFILSVLNMLIILNIVFFLNKKLFFFLKRNFHSLHTFLIVLKMEM